MGQHELSHVNVAKKIDVHNLLKNLEIWGLFKLSVRCDPRSEHANVDSRKFPYAKIYNLLAVSLKRNLAHDVVHIEIAEFAVALAHKIFKCLFVSA